MVINTSRRLDTGHECYGRLLRTPSATINRSSRPPIAPIALSRTNTCHQLRPPRAVSVGSQNAPQTSSNRGIPATQSGIEDVTASLGVLGQPVSRQVTVLTALLEQLQGAGSTQAKVSREHLWATWHAFSARMHCDALPSTVCVQSLDIRHVDP